MKPDLPISLGGVFEVTSEMQEGLFHLRLRFFPGAGFVTFIRSHGSNEAPSLSAIAVINRKTVSGGSSGSGLIELNVAHRETECSCRLLLSQSQR